jgi:hypothetical protein
MAIKEKTKTRKEISTRLIAEFGALKEEIRSDILGPVIASFGFIIALIWRDAIRSTINELLSRAGLLENVYIYDIISAIIVTIIVIGIMLFITRLRKKRKKKRFQKAVKEKVQELKKHK